jgi:spermidine/putrescine transport system permease protein
MKSESLLIRIGLALYLIMFFTYLIGPLILMSITAFNSAAFPQITPWEVLSFEWFPKLFNDDRIINGLKYSLIVGFFTVILSVSMGLAGALILTQVWPKMRATYYTIIIAPILVPGVVIGISTLVFWARINTMLGLEPDSFLANGIFLTVLGQSTFIASYCMLVFVARMQRYDTGLTEAALDLGASHVKAFRRIQLPFLMPAMGFV